MICPSAGFRYNRIVKFCVIAIILFASFSSTAQPQADKWYFGNQSGVDFSGPTPAAATGSMNTLFGNSSISDSAGNLLFYTDGQNVWNRNHVLMSNGTGLLGGPATQSALIIPKPGSATEYYIFTNDVTSGPNGMQYSLVDMSLDSGRGEVTAMNFFLEDELTEKLAATSTRSGDGYWITVHEYSGDIFYNFKLTSSGIDPNIVYSAVGTPHNSATPQNGTGQMKYSSCGNKLAVAIGAQNIVEIFDFDDSTGIVSNPVTIPVNGLAFGIEFSPNGKLLYVTTEGSATLHQYDLSSGIQADIINSEIILSAVPGLYGLQTGNDGKIYIAKFQSSFIAGIAFPDLAGTACNFIDSIVDLDPSSLGHICGYCLPEFPQSLFRDSMACAPINTGLETIYSFNMNVFPNPSDQAFTIPVSELSALKLYDCHGALLDEIETNSPLTIGENLPSGLYFLHITNSSSVNFLKLLKK